MGWDDMLSKEVRALFSKEQYIFSYKLKGRV